MGDHRYLKATSMSVHLGVKTTTIPNLVHKKKCQVQVEWKLGAA